MAEQQSETSSDVESINVIEELLVTQQHRDELMEMLRWNTAVLSVILQEAGGVIEISLSDVAGVDLNKANTLVSIDEDRNVVIVEGVFGDEPGTAGPASV